MAISISKREEVLRLMKNSNKGADWKNSRATIAGTSTLRKTATETTSQSQNFKNLEVSELGVI